MNSSVACHFGPSRGFLSLHSAPMLHVRLLSGEELAKVPLQDELRDVRALNLGDEIDPNIGVIYPEYDNFL